MFENGLQQIIRVFGKSKQEYFSLVLTVHLKEFKHLSDEEGILPRLCPSALMLVRGNKVNG